MLTQWTIDQPNSLYSIIQQDQDKQIKSLNDSISFTQIISFLSIIVLAIFIAAIRLKDNMNLVRYYKTLEFIGE